MQYSVIIIESDEHFGKVTLGWSGEWSKRKWY